MTVERFWSLSLALPVAMPVVTAPLGLLMRSDSDFLEAVAGAWLWFILAPAFYLGVPYLVWAYAALRWLRGKPAHAIRRAALLAPLTFASIVFGLALLISLLSGDSVARAVVAASFFAVFAVLVGYGYVAVAFALKSVLAASGNLANAHS